MPASPAAAPCPGVFEQPTVRLAVAGAAAVELDRRAHAAAGDLTAGRCATGPADLAALPAPDPGVLRVLAGDFNATLDHAALRAVLRTGWADAARRTGRGLAWTWRPLRLPWPRLVLDHVLVDPRIGVAAVDAGAACTAATTGPSSSTWCCPG